MEFSRPGEAFELFLPRISPLPDELHLELGRRSRSVDAYWNGCALVSSAEAAQPPLIAAITSTREPLASGVSSPARSRST